MNGYVRPRQSTVLPAFRFAARATLFGGLLLGLMLGLFTLAGMAVTTI